MLPSTPRNRIYSASTPSIVRTVAAVSSLHPIGLNIQRPPRLVFLEQVQAKDGHAKKELPRPGMHRACCCADVLHVPRAGDYDVGCCFECTFMLPSVDEPWNGTIFTTA